MVRGGAGGSCTPGGRRYVPVDGAQRVAALALLARIELCVSPRDGQSHADGRAVEASVMCDRAWP
jgi:hypothetical protein